MACSMVGLTALKQHCNFPVARWMESMFRSFSAADMSMVANWTLVPHFGGAQCDGVWVAVLHLCQSSMRACSTQPSMASFTVWRLQSHWRWIPTHCLASASILSLQCCLIDSSRWSRSSCFVHLIRKSSSMTRVEETSCVSWQKQPSATVFLCPCSSSLWTRLLWAFSLPASNHTRLCSPLRECNCHVQLIGQGRNGP